MYLILVQPLSATYCRSLLISILIESSAIVWVRFSESIALFFTMSFFVFEKYSTPFNEYTNGLGQVNVSTCMVPLKSFTSLLVMSINFPVLSNAFGQIFAFR